jgi:hypothetical protein
MPSHEVVPDNPPQEPFASQLPVEVFNPLRRYVPLAAWLIVILTLLAIPAKIVGYGYLPADDALRHAAKAVSGKPWSEILVLRSGFLMDPHPGWHAILGCVHRLSNWGTEGLVVFSIASLMLLFHLAVLPWLRRPEAWLAGLLICLVCVHVFADRLAEGRPFLFTISASLVVLLMWSRIHPRGPRLHEIAFTILLIAAVAWIHGSFYQMLMPVAAVFLSGRWRAAVWLGLCWAAGSFLGSSFTGHPWEFLDQSIRHLFAVFSDYTLARQIATELGPSDGDALLVLAVVGMLLWRSHSPGWKASDLAEPFFVMAVLGWLLGLKTLRFWWDWGLPAATVWFALEFQQQFQTHLGFNSWKRLWIVLALALGVYLNTTSDLGSRWTWNLTNEYLEQDKPELASWLPGNGGILYSADMRVFFETFFKNPTAPWRYVLGFESSLMKPEDLAVLRKVQWNFGNVRAYEPWIKKMGPKDRLVLRASWLGPGIPNIPELEWHYAVNDLWVGRLPQKPSPSAVRPRP